MNWKLPSCVSLMTAIAVAHAGSWSNITGTLTPVTAYNDLYSSYITELSLGSGNNTAALTLTAQETSSLGGDSAAYVQVQVQFHLYYTVAQGESLPSVLYAHRSINSSCRASYTGLDVEFAMSAASVSPPSPFVGAHANAGTKTGIMSAAGDMTSSYVLSFTPTWTLVGNNVYVTPTPIYTSSYVSAGGTYVGDGSETAIAVAADTFTFLTS